MKKVAFFSKEYEFIKKKQYIFSYINYTKILVKSL